MGTRVAVVGATGTMGRLAIDLLERTDDFEVGPRLDSRSSLDELAGAELAIDLTAPAVSPRVVDAALGHGVPVLVGTSGWSADRLLSLARRLEDLPELGAIVIPN